LTDLQEEIKALAKKKSANAVLVFSVKECTNPAGKAKNRRLGFSMSEVGTKAEYGEFNHNKRYFTVVTAGIYKFDFTGLVLRTNGSCKHHFQLQVDGVVKSECQAYCRKLIIGQIYMKVI